MSERSVESSGNVFADIGFDQAEATMLLVRARLMLALTKQLKALGKTQTEVAKILQIGQSRVSDLMKGKAKLFSLDMLLLLAQRLGMQVNVAVESSGAAQQAQRAVAEPAFRRVLKPNATSHQIHRTPWGTATGVILAPSSESSVGIGPAHIHESGTVVGVKRYRFAQAKSTEVLPEPARRAA
jgi:predicted XRE-type DNA-binding protein